MRSIWPWPCSATRTAATTIVRWDLERRIQTGWSLEVEYVDDGNGGEKAIGRPAAATPPTRGA